MSDYFEIKSGSYQVDDSWRKKPGRKSMYPFKEMLPGQWIVVGRCHEFRLYRAVRYARRTGIIMHVEFARNGDFIVRRHA